MARESGDFKPEKAAIAPKTLSFHGDFDYIRRLPNKA